MSLPNPKTIDMKLNPVTPGVTRTKRSALEDEIVERKVKLATEDFSGKFCGLALKEETDYQKKTP